MIDEFLLRSGLGAIGVALAAGPLGCVILWRRMAYFGETLAHASLLGASLGILLNISPFIGVLTIAIGMGALLVRLQERKTLATDTLLGLMAHVALAAGVIVAAKAEGMRIDLMSLLFGDVLAIGWAEVPWIWLGAGLVLAGLAWIWSPLVTATFDEELARAEGIRTRHVHLAFTVLIALTVAMAMQVVGVLLVTALLIIPAAAARPRAITPEAMAVWAAALAMLAVPLGFALSLAGDTPTGPTIVIALMGLFVLSHLLPGRKD